MIYVDANIFIYSVTSKSGEIVSLCRNVLSKIVEGEEQGFTSVLTWDEFFWITRRVLGFEHAKVESAKFLNTPNLKFILADEKIVRNAQTLTELYGLKPRDAIHAASALSHGITRFVSSDPDFDAVKELKRIPIGEFK